ncbi:MAG TPA: hypothetical protein VFL55_05930 [Acetobacteraceae bacterium]|nr:hypothetical protein [Acetobacteraceae bacterium]
MHTTPALPDLPPAILREAYAQLLATLPPAFPDTPEARATRDQQAMEAWAALDPGNAFEADLAVQIVGAGAHARECFRLAAAAGDDHAEGRRCRAQAGLMMRQAQSGTRLLERRQAAREKALKALEPRAMERAGYWFKDVSVPAPETDAAGEPKLTEAEHYAVLYPDRAARIRAAGGLPTPLDFGPPEAWLVPQIVRGTGPVFDALDREVGAGVSGDETMSQQKAS